MYLHNRICHFCAAAADNKNCRWMRPNTCIKYAAQRHYVAILYYKYLYLYIPFEHNLYTVQRPTAYFKYLV